MRTIESPSQMLSNPWFVRCTAPARPGARVALPPTGPFQVGTARWALLVHTPPRHCRRLLPPARDPTPPGPLPGPRPRGPLRHYSVTFSLHLSRTWVDATPSEEPQTLEEPGCPPHTPSRALSLQGCCHHCSHASAHGRVLCLLRYVSLVSPLITS